MDNIVWKHIVSVFDKLSWSSADTCMVESTTWLQDVPAMKALSTTYLKYFIYKWTQLLSMYEYELKIGLIWGIDDLAMSAHK